MFEICSTAKSAILHIKGTKNNTKLVLTDITGQETIYTGTGGIFTKKGRDKSGQKIGTVLFNNLIQDLRLKKIKDIEIRVSNKGSMYTKTITSTCKYIIGLFPDDFTILDKLQVSPTIHGFMRKKGGRRGVRK